MKNAIKVRELTSRLRIHQLLSKDLVIFDKRLIEYCVVLQLNGRHAKNKYRKYFQPFQQSSDKALKKQHWATTSVVFKSGF